MSPLVLALVLASALLHVLWNTLVKQCGNKLSFAWLTTVAGNAVLLPALLAWGVWTTWTGSTGGPLQGLSPEVLFWAAASGLLETLYVVCLFKAYEAADLTVVYPVSRGAAPVVALALAGLLVGDVISAQQALAVAVVVCGTLLVGLSGRPRLPKHMVCAATRRLTARGLVLSVATGVAIAGYHLTDRRAMGLSPAPDPLCYLLLMHVFMSLFVTLWAWRRSRSLAALCSEWARSPRDVILVAVFTPLSYFLIVLALREGNVVLITAARNVGILFSTLAGAYILRERVTGARGWGSALIMAGLAGMAFLRG